MDVVLYAFHEGGVVVFGCPVHYQQALYEHIDADDGEQSQRNHDNSTFDAKLPKGEIGGGFYCHNCLFYLMSVLLMFFRSGRYFRAFL